MPLVCPCDRSDAMVEQQVINGIITYKHKDGSSCDLLNSFYKDDRAVSYVCDILTKAIKDKDYEIFNIYYTKSSNHVFFEICKQLASMNRYELEDFFDFIYGKGSSIKKDVIDKIDYELIKIFGEVVVRNIALYDDNRASILKTKYINNSMPDRIFNMEQL